MNAGAQVQQLLQQAVTHHRAGQVAEADRLYRQVLTLDSRNADALHLLGVIRRNTPHAEEGIALIREALAVNPNLLPALRNLGNALSDAGRYAEAADCYRRFLAHEPREAECWVSLGAACRFLGKRGDSLRAYERAVELEPEITSHRFERALGRLYFGDFAGGWEDWEQRWNQPQLKPLRPQLPHPEWQGEDPAGKTIFVYAEQGYGDTFQFVRYLPLMVRRGARVVFGAQPELRRVLAPMMADMEWYESGTQLPPFDLQVPLLSLPRCFDTCLDTIPAETPYMGVDPVLAAEWKQRLDQLAGGAGGKRVGLVWTGRPTHGNDRNRSLTPELVAPLLQVPGVQFFSLQKEPRPGHLEALRGFGTVHDCGPFLNDFADTAAALSHLDLLLSVDTSVAHLGGAVGTPIWVFVPFSADWRWVHGRETSAWYPGSRLFRQDDSAQWPAAVAQAAEALAGFAG